MKSAKRTTCLSPSQRADAARPTAAQTGANLIKRKARRAFTLAAVALLVLTAMASAQEREHRHDADAEQQQASDRDRWMWQLPEAVIDAIGVEAGMVVADVGGGKGTGSRASAYTMPDWWTRDSLCWASSARRGRFWVRRPRTWKCASATSSWSSVR